MPDIDHLPFDRARVAAAVRPVPLWELHARAARRRQRRIASAAAAVAVLLTTAGVVAGVAFGAAPRPDGKPATPVTATPAPSVMPTDLAMLSEDSAVAFWAGCPARFTHTTDRGRHWSTPARVPPAQHCDPGQPDDRWLVLDARTYLYSIDGTRYLTADGGLTWKAGSAGIADVDALPEAARVADCGAHTRCFMAPDAGPYAVDSGGGVAYRLAKQPPGRSVGRYQQAGDVLWATLYGGGSGTGEIGWSTDGGATWKRHPLGVQFGADNVAALDKNRAWVSYTPQIGSPQHILRTADGGRTWQDVTTDLPVTSNVRDLVVRPDGALLVVEPDPFAAWISTDDGKHFAVSPGPAADRDSLRLGSGPGVAWAMWGDPVQLVVTTDAKTWSAFPLP